MKVDSTAGTLCELDLAVPTMVCDGCADTIRTALLSLPGVREVKVSLWRKRVRVRYERGRLGEGEMKDAIVASGFTVRDSSGPKGREMKAGTAGAAPPPPAKEPE